MTPKERYQLDLQQKGFSPDPFQLSVIEKIDQLYYSICRGDGQKKHWLRQLFSPEPARANGLYLWGGVGRGKTYLVDLLFASLPFEEKSRIHFHAFMLHIHEQLHLLGDSPNPLRKVGKLLAQKYRVICLDEFQVQDIADAMILANLLDALFANNITVLITSNTAPEKLYEKGIQRQSFLKAIALIGKKMEVIHLEEGRDFRKQSLQDAGNYLLLDENSAEADRQLHLYLQMFSASEPRTNQTIVVNDREIIARAVGDRVVWFDAYELCGKAHSAQDYLALAQSFDVFLVSELPLLDEEKDSFAKRFMNLIDILYDEKKKLVVSAKAMPEELYSGRDLQQSFQRTASRLVEMSSQQYFSGSG